MWTEENINNAASTYVADDVCNYYLRGVDVSEGIKDIIREGFIAGAKYVIYNTQKYE